MADIWRIYGGYMADIKKDNLINLFDERCRRNILSFLSELKT